MMKVVVGCHDFVVKCHQPMLSFNLIQVLHFFCDTQIYPDQTVWYRLYLSLPLGYLSTSPWLSGSNHCSWLKISLWIRIIQGSNFSVYFCCIFMFAVETLRHKASVTSVIWFHTFAIFFAWIISSCLHIICKTYASICRTHQICIQIK